MSSLIGALRVTLGIDTAAYSAGLSKAETMTVRSMKSITAAIAGFATGVGISAITSLAKRALDYASSLGTVAQQLGVSTDALQEYRYAASQVGIEQDTMDRGLAKLTLTIGKAATGGKQQSAVFKALGIDIRNSNGAIRDAGEVIPEIADALAQIPDPARRAAVETKLFGDAGQKLDTLLAGGSRRVNELRDAAQRLGIVLSSEQIQKADYTASKLEDVKKVLEARIAGVVADNAKEILNLAEALAELASKAIQALAAWTKFRQTMNARETMVANADAYLDSRKDLSSSARTRAKSRAREIIDDRLGIETESVGGFWGALGAKTRRLKPSPASETGAASGTPPKTSAPDISNISGTPGRTRKTRGHNGPTAAEIEQRFNDQLISYTQQALSSMQSMAKSADERAEYELRGVEWARNREIADINADKHYSAEQKARLRQQVEEIAARERERVEFEKTAAVEREIADIADARYNVDRGALDDQYDLARTAEERRALAKEMLDLEYRHKEAMLKAIIASKTADDVDRQRAQIALDALAGQRGAAMEKARRDTAGPLESFFDSLPKSAAEANQAMEEVAAGGLGSIIDGLAEAGVGARYLGETFRDVARQIVADLIRIQLRKAIVSGLSSALNFGGGGFNAGAAISSANAAIDAGIASFHLPGFARGGMFPVGGAPGVDTNLLSINGVPRARVSASEHIAVIPNNGGGGRSGGSVSFDLRGAVMTADLVAQMQRMATSTGGVAAMAGASMGEQKVFRRMGRKLPG